MEDLNKLQYLKKTLKDLESRHKELKDELSYYKNRCDFLKKIIKKFKLGIKRIIN